MKLFCAQPTEAVCRYLRMKVPMQLLDEAILDRGIAYFVPTLSCNLDDFLRMR